jgi:hypothetical protein
MAAGFLSANKQVFYQHATRAVEWALNFFREYGLWAVYDVSTAPEPRLNRDEDRPGPDSRKKAAAGNQKDNHAGSKPWGPGSITKSFREH